MTARERRWVRLLVAEASLDLGAWVFVCFAGVYERLHDTVRVWMFAAFALATCVGAFFAARARRRAEDVL